MALPPPRNSNATSTRRCAQSTADVTTAMIAEGLVATVVLVAFVAQVVMTVTVVVVMTVAMVAMVVMTVIVVVAMTEDVVALVAVTVAVIVLVVMTVALGIMTVTPAVLLLMPSPVTLGTAVLRLLPTAPSYHPPSTMSSKSRIHLRYYPKFLLRALPHSLMCLHRHRAYHFLRLYRSFLLSPLRLCHMGQILSSPTHCQPTTHLVRLLRLCHSRQLPLSWPRCQPTTGLPLMQAIFRLSPIQRGSRHRSTTHSTHRDHYFTSQPTQPKWIFHCSPPVTSRSPRPIKVVLQLPPQCVDGIRPHPPFQVMKGNGFLPYMRISATARKSGGPPLPKAVTYAPTKFPALREHWIVDSSASTLCTPNRDYFSRYIPCALSLTVGNGATLPVVGYGSISMLVDMSPRDQVDDIRTCTLRLDFGLHCHELQFNLFSVRQASDDNITVRFPARDICEITTSFGDVLNAPNNAMGLYSFPAQPKFVGTDPRFRAMMASFETALRTFLTLNFPQLVLRAFGIAVSAILALMPSNK
ncbi:hypothetical protein H257_05588 [Aphanomyces astaci]|uniref:Retrovirus-related Pol polyprotein from transposon TNT 1-94-like beta-barrel domain-containing protein n=1 Tax=Aphanomyces astaci TaxID=112090 RepID=W4GT85_APHAT|nr:hypothetical protein H257_05588 [Aphanomyces astaci]ETV82073.1 hypothetical protein H257_05588 [Aphanomyces astaci]|eukprot:XP_009828810.1 hypothetical protein H257_05588 [Aphanomyces astaci]